MSFHKIAIGVTLMMATVVAGFRDRQVENCVELAAICAMQTDLGSRYSTPGSLENLLKGISEDDMMTICSDVVPSTDSCLHGKVENREYKCPVIEKALHSLTDMCSSPNELGSHVNCILKLVNHMTRDPTDQVGKCIADERVKNGHPHPDTPTDAAGVIALLTNCKFLDDINACVGPLVAQVCDENVAKSYEGYLIKNVILPFNPNYKDTC